MGNLGVPELIFIFVLALLIFGPRKLPELGRNLGKALAEFRRHSAELRVAVDEEMRELEQQAREAEAKAQQALDPLAEPATPAEEPVGSGPIDPQQGSSPQPVAAAVAAEETEEKRADGDTKPA